MKMCTYIKDEIPCRTGETRIYPDELAERLVTEGIVAENPPDWPRPEVSAEFVMKAKESKDIASLKGKTRDMTPEKPVPVKRTEKQHYKTK